jgi:nucleotide-binding universal stress UspA family protein
MKILLAVDGSDISNEMVEEFSGRTFAPNTEVLIISAYEMVSLITTAALLSEAYQYHAMADKELLKSAENATQNAVSVLQKKMPQLSFSTAAIEGSPKSIILKEAETFCADLIVLGSHGHGAVTGFLLGSVSQSVALHAKCSVEIVRIKKRNK